MTDLTLELQPRIAFDYRNDIYRSVSFLTDEFLLFSVGRLLCIENYKETIFIGSQAAKPNQTFILRQLKENETLINNESLNLHQLSYSSLNHSNSSIANERKNLLQQTESIQLSKELNSLRKRLFERESILEHDSLCLSAFSVHPNQRLIAVAEYSLSLNTVVIKIIDRKSTNTSNDHNYSYMNGNGINMKSATVNTLLLPTTVFDAEKAEELRKFQFTRRRKKINNIGNISNNSNSIASKNKKKVGMEDENLNILDNNSVFDIDSDFDGEDHYNNTTTTTTTTATANNNTKSSNLTISSTPVHSPRLAPASLLSLPKPSTFSSSSTFNPDLSARISIFTKIELLSFSPDGKCIAFTGNGPKYPLFFWFWQENTKIANKPRYLYEPIKFIQFHPNQSKTLLLITNNYLFQFQSNSMIQTQLLTQYSNNTSSNNLQQQSHSDYWVCFTYISSYLDCFIICKSNLILIVSMGLIIQTIEIDKKIKILSITESPNGFIIGTTQNLQLYQFKHSNQPLIHPNNEFSSVIIEKPKKHSLLLFEEEKEEENQEKNKFIDKNTTIQAILIKDIPILDVKKQQQTQSQYNNDNNSSNNESKEYKNDLLAESAYLTIQSIVCSPSKETIAITTNDRQLLTLNIKDLELLTEETTVTTATSSNNDTNSIHNNHSDGWRKKVKNNLNYQLFTQSIFKSIIKDLPNSPIHSISISTDQPYFLSVAPLENRLFLYNFIERQCELNYSFDSMGTKLVTACIHPTGLELAISLTNSILIARWSHSQTLTVRGELLVSNGNKIVYSPTGNLIAVIQGKIISIYSNTTLKLYNRLQGHSDQINDLLWSEDENFITSIGNNGYFYTFNIKENFIKQEFIMDNSYFTSICQDNQGKLIATAINRVTGNNQRKLNLFYENKADLKGNNTSAIENVHQFVNYKNKQEANKENNNHIHNVMASTTHGRTIFNFSAIQSTLLPVLPPISTYSQQSVHSNAIHSNNASLTPSFTSSPVLTPTIPTRSISTNNNTAGSNNENISLSPTNATTNTTTNYPTSTQSKLIPFTSPFYLPQILTSLITIGRAQFLLIATHRGTIEVWPYPLSLNSKALTITSLHSEPITSLKIHQKTSTIITCSLDGSVFISSLALIVDKIALPEDEIINSSNQSNNPTNTVTTYKFPLLDVISKPFHPMFFSLYEPNLLQIVQGVTKKQFESKVLIDQKQFELDKNLYGIKKLESYTEYKGYQLISNSDLIHLKSELNDLKQQLNSIQTEYLYKLQRDHYSYEKNNEKLNFTYRNEINSLNQSIRGLELMNINKEKIKLKELNDREIEKNKIIQELEIIYERKLSLEAEKIKKLYREMNEKLYEEKSEKMNVKMEKERIIEKNREEYERELKEKNELIENLQKQLKKASYSAVEMIESQEVEFDSEMIIHTKKNENSIESLMNELKENENNNNLLKAQLIQIKQKLNNYKVKNLDLEKLIKEFEFKGEIEEERKLNENREKMKKIEEIEEQRKELYEAYKENERLTALNNEFLNQIEFLLAENKLNQGEEIKKKFELTMKSVDSEVMEYNTVINQLKREISEKKQSLIIVNSELEEKNKESKLMGKLIQTMNKDLNETKDFYLFKDKYTSILNDLQYKNGGKDSNSMVVNELDSNQILFELQRQKLMDLNLLEIKNKSIDTANKKVNEINNKRNKDYRELMGQINELRSENKELQIVVKQLKYQNNYKNILLNQLNNSKNNRGNLGNKVYSYELYNHNYSDNNDNNNELRRLTENESKTENDFSSTHSIAEYERILQSSYQKISEQDETIKTLKKQLTENKLTNSINNTNNNNSNVIDWNSNSKVSAYVDSVLEKAEKLRLNNNNSRNRSPMISHPPMSARTVNSTINNPLTPHAPAYSSQSASNTPRNNFSSTSTTRSNRVQSSFVRKTPMNSFRPSTASS